MQNILVTGAAGFIGYHVTKRLCGMGFAVTGVDSLVPYYSPELKKARLQDIGINPSALKKNELARSVLFDHLAFFLMDVADRQTILSLFQKGSFDCVVHLAAQPGVRASLTHPDQYIYSNIQGWLSILEAARHYPVDHLIFASSSSVYGNNREVPFSESDRVDEPVSLYAATKKSGELMGYTYSHLYHIPLTALRFFTVYGPWGRPDMAYFKFVDAIESGQPIDVYNQGDLYRDFTYVDDVVDGIVKLIDKKPGIQPPYRVLNIGHSSPVKLMEFIGILENLLDKKANLNFLPMQPGDVLTTYANVKSLEELVGYHPETDLREGLSNFVTWYKDYHKAKEVGQNPVGHE
jgi:UDP-glucuronate 4-epimerase